MQRWEYHIISHLHETKIKSKAARLVLGGTYIYDSFMFGEIKRWDLEPASATQ